MTAGAVITELSVMGIIGAVTGNAGPWSTFDECSTTAVAGIAVNLLVGTIDLEL